MKKNCLYIVLILSLIVCAYAFIFLLKPLDVFLWDESHHAFYGMQIFDDLRFADIKAFWMHTNAQALWMPLHSWVVAVFLFIFGFSYTSARLSSLFLFFGGSVLTYLIGEKLSKDKGPYIGLTASILYLVSPMLLGLSVMNMQEMLGLALALGMVYYMIATMDSKTPWKDLMTGLFLGITYWTKTNFAAQAVLGVGVFQLSTYPFKDNKKGSINKWWRDNLIIAAGFLSLFLLWWLTPPFERKWSLGISFRQGSVSAPGTSMLSGFISQLIFYSKSLMTSYNISIITGVLCIAAAIYAFGYFHDKKLRLVHYMFLANIFFISIMSFNFERYASTTVPLIFILLAYSVFDIGGRLYSDQKWRPVLFVLLALFLVQSVIDISKLTSFTRETTNRTYSAIMFKDSVEKYSPPKILGLFDRPAFTYPILPAKEHQDFGVTPTSSLNDVLNFIGSSCDNMKSISVFVRMDELSPYVIYWHFHGWKAYVLSVNDLAAGNVFWNMDYIIGLDIKPSSPYYPDVLETRWPQIEKMLISRGYVRLAAKKEFGDLGITAKIYERIKPVTI